MGGRTSEQVLGEEEVLEEVAQKGEDLHTHPIKTQGSADGFKVVSEGIELCAHRFQILIGKTDFWSGLSFDCY